MRNNFAKLLKQLRKNFPQADLEIVRKAYRRANEAHQGQMRLSGEPYVMHSIAVAQILALLGLDPVTCAAGLLHDVLEDTDMTRESLTAEFGEETATLVDGVTKISGLSFLNTASERAITQAQNIRKMLVATARDVRVILIKLADRLHNMRTIEFLPTEKRLRIARETLDIHAPLAHRLGISEWRWELEDHAFRQLKPDVYREIATQVATRRREREAELKKTIAFLQDHLQKAEIPAQVIGRAKHFYSIYNKMVRQGKTFEELMDVQGVRIITQTESGCYNALGVVHSLWTPMPGRLKDYIAMPKLNMYRGIHTTVMRENGRPMEIQIRSEEMDRTAREGVAAHWIYKEGEKAQDKKLEEQLAWLRQMYEWLKDTTSTEELLDSMRRDFRESNIYVFTPKGEVKELPSGATPLDFAYLIHSHIGHHCMGARVNGRMVPLRYHLQTGDVVEILTSKNQTPHLSWLDIVVTGRARTRIRQRLRELGELEPLEETPSKPKEHRTPQRPAHTPIRTVRQVDDATRHKLIRIEGAKGMTVQFAKCCDPMPGHAVLGYVTRTPGITVHRVDCKSFRKSPRDPKRIVDASWEGEGVFEAAMRITIGQRPNGLVDIADALRPMNLEILSAHYMPEENGRSTFDIVFEVSDQQMLETITRALRSVAGVAQVKQVSVRERSARRLAEAG